jgi:alanine racemase
LQLLVLDQQGYCLGNFYIKLASIILFGRQGNAEVQSSDLTSLTGHILTEAYTPWSNSNPQVIKPIQSPQQVILTNSKVAATAE